MNCHFITDLRQIPQKCISDVDSVKTLFLTSPCKDFTRNSKISFSDVLQPVMLPAGKSMSNEVMDYFGHSSSSPSAPAFQQ